MTYKNLADGLVIGAASKIIITSLAIIFGPHHMDAGFVAGAAIVASGMFAEFYLRDTADVL